MHTGRTSLTPDRRRGPVAAPSGWPAALADLGCFALRSGGLPSVLGRVVDLAAHHLNTPVSVVSRLVNPGQARIEAAHGWFGVPVGEVTPLPVRLQGEWAAGTPMLVGDWNVEPAGYPAGEVEAAGVTASLSVSVLVARTAWGRLSVHDVRPRRWRRVEVDFLQSVANVLAAAIERDRMESRLRHTNTQLQRALLPARLPEVPGLDLAARYVPADSVEIGGDWYDVLPLPDGGAALVIGDVEGHDSTAAAVVGQARTAVRTYVAEGHPPAEVMALANAFIHSATDRLVSCWYAEVRPRQGLVTCVDAGHPAPLVVTGDGAAGELVAEPGLLLGVDPQARYRERTTVLPPGALLLLTTDGLLDQAMPGAPYASTEALVDAARAVLDRAIGEVADHLVRAGGDGRPLRDDVALLAARVTAADPVTGEAARWFGPHPATCTAARVFTADLLAAWGLRQLRMDAELAVSELVSNVLTHTTSAVRLTLRRVGPDRVRIGAYDTSDRMPAVGDASEPVAAFDLDALEEFDLDAFDEDDPDGHAISGRGLHIIGELAQSWGVTPDSGGGKTVWLELG